MTSEISGYIEYNYPTEQNISKHNIKLDMRISTENSVSVLSI